MKTKNEKTIVINLNCCHDIKECPIPTPLDNSDTVFTDLAAELIEKILTFKIFPRTFTDAELKSMAQAFFEENLDLNSIRQLFENYFSIKSEQLAIFYKYEREASLGLFNDSPFDLKDFEKMLPKIEKASEEIIKKCDEQFNKPFHVLALMGVSGVDTIVEQAFKNVNLSDVSLKGDCPSESYPYLYPIGAGIFYSGWSISTRKRSGSSDACNYHHYGFNKNIKSIIPLSASIISLASIYARIKRQIVRTITCTILQNRIYFNIAIDTSAFSKSF